MSMPLRRRNGVTVLASLMVIAAMGSLVYYSVPLYRLFCQVTGFGGTTQEAAVAPGAVGERTITIQFNADVSAKLPWTFRPAQREIKVRVGEEALAFFVATNRGEAPVTGSAIFNVTPHKAGPYFNKIACFCFTEQRLAAGETAEMPVSFFVDPAILDDRNLDDVGTITLSYIFYRADGDGQKPDKQVSQAAAE